MARKPLPTPPEERGSIFIAPKAEPAVLADPDVPPDPDLPPEPSPPEPPDPALAAPEPVAAPNKDSTASVRPPAPPSPEPTSESRLMTLNAPAVGEVIDLGAGAGSYSLIRRLGRGGMAEVWLARRAAAGGFQRDVALKRIRPDHLADDDEAELYRKMFLDEARLAAALTHPGIAQVYDLQDRGDGTYYLIMEYVPGCTLREAVVMSDQKGRAFSQGFACYVISQVADALHYAYNARGPNGSPLRIVHRDVNPKNVMLGQNGEVKLLDFGIAYSYLDNRDRTRTGVVKGTYSYMSPEQADGTPRLDTRSDLFALGIMLSELLTGKRPFDGGAHHETRTIAKIMAASPEDVAAVTTQLPEELASIVARALSKDPTDRFIHGAELAAALRTYMINAHLLCGPSEAVQELHELEETPDRPDPQATRVRSPNSNSSPRVKIFSPVETEDAPSPAKRTPAATPPAGQVKNPRAPTETRLQKRAATREKLRNPEDPKPRLVKPILLICGVAIVAQLVVLLFIKMNRQDPATAKIEVVKTPTQLRAEQEAEERARLPQATRPQLAEVQDPNAALAAAVNTALPSSPNASTPVAPTTVQTSVTPSSTATPRPRPVRMARAAPAPAEPTPEIAPAPPPVVRHRSLDSSTATAFADTPSTPSTSTPEAGAVARGTLIAAALTTPADAGNPGPVTATVTKDVAGPAGVAIPKSSSLICQSSGPLGQGRVGVTCSSIIIRGRAVPLTGTAMGADQLRGIPVVASGGAGTGEPARSGAINTAGRVARRVLTGDGIAGDILDEALGAGQETARRATAPRDMLLQPAPKGTRFFVFLDTFGGAP